MKPFVKTGHRFGNVFLHLVNDHLGRRTSHVIKLTPERAEEIGRELIDLARRARKEKPVRLKLVK